MTHINEAREALKYLKTELNEFCVAYDEMKANDKRFSILDAALTASQEQQAEIEVLRAALTVASGALSEASDKFHVLSFYIKDTPARECCEAKVGEMFSANKIARQALSPERGGE